MNKKRFMVLGIVLVLMATVVGITFAQSRRGTLDGVTWATIEGKSNRLPGQTTSHYTQVYNENNYSVRVTLSRLHNNEVLHRDISFSAGETQDFGGQFYVSNVRR